MDTFQVNNTCLLKIKNLTKYFNWIVGTVNVVQIGKIGQENIMIKKKIYVK